MKKYLKGLVLAACIMSFSTSALADGYVFSKNIYKVKMNHKDVKVIQEALKKDGVFHYYKTTTYFGPITEKATKEFQRKNGLKVDGIVGKSTIGKMRDLGLIYENKKSISRSYVFSRNVYKLGMKHSDIKVLQEGLKKDGAFNYNKTTTYFGPITEKAVKSFQKKYGLKADGIIGKATINKMKKLGLIDGSMPKTSRGYSKRKVGEYLDWWTQVSNKIIHRGDNLRIEDLKTGKTFNVKMTVGTNHADCETLTKKDTAIMKEIWGGFSWERRPVLVYKDGRIIAASMSNMPHAGREDQPAGKTVSNRSGGFGRGYNYDFIKGNGMDGHVDLHFKNSMRHKDNKKDPKHQRAVKEAAGIR
ncbi:peptidoglycan-binding protein [Crassaminicella thermophila]|uniref:Peptidoglycan-binding protein n=1 Tax=Crassaminicella thermophila TaxID=2599308 RepID=A0A5C0SGX8_CRATE|nr:peptidoglycan-binding protein [Crassaminicella thermophila]QEK12664.1 peptidoglycan-binding protein [Crassaminicella thermophila]